MAESVYKIIELVGTSTESWEKAAAAAVEDLREIVSFRGRFSDQARTGELETSSGGIFAVGRREFAESVRHAMNQWEFAPRLRDGVRVVQTQHGRVPASVLLGLAAVFLVAHGRVGGWPRRLVPLATADQNGNRFRVEASLDEKPEGLRPGMQGVAKVVTGRTSVLQAWTGELVDRLRFWFWSIGL
mgnify:CR=1 FL=1